MVKTRGFCFEIKFDVNTTLNTDDIARTEENVRKVVEPRSLEWRMKGLERCLFVLYNSGKVTMIIPYDYYLSGAVNPRDYIKLLLKKLQDKGYRVPIETKTCYEVVPRLTINLRHRLDLASLAKEAWAQSYMSSYEAAYWKEIAGPGTKWIKHPGCTSDEARCQSSATQTLGENTLKRAHSEKIGGPGEKWMKLSGLTLDEGTYGVESTECIQAVASTRSDEPASQSSNVVDTADPSSTTEAVASTSSNVMDPGEHSGRSSVEGGDQSSATPPVASVNSTMMDTDDPASSTSNSEMDTGSNQHTRCKNTLKLYIGSDPAGTVVVIRPLGKISFYHDSYYPGCHLAMNETATYITDLLMQNGDLKQLEVAR